MNFVWLLFGVFVSSWSLTLVLRRYALVKSLVDVPNDRSSHTVPTPRGGGVAIVLSFGLALSLVASQGKVAQEDVYGLLGAGLLIALVGFVDDHGHIAAKWRLLCHFSASSWALFWMGGLPPIVVLDVPLSLGWLGSIVAAIYMVWMLNLYNFMDGIDGLASAQAVTICLAMSLLCWFSGDVQLIPSLLLLAVAVCGFLCWNFPPARIFMGDAGSGFLGIVLAFMSLEAAWVNPRLLWCWLILLGVFIVDATWTLVRRLIRGEKIYEAHRSHAYQNAALIYSSHRAVTLGVVVINICWLLPLALMVASGHVPGLAALVISYLPLLGLSWHFNGGGERRLE
jgi:Fuc2NAc and GlcNAc transferase